MDPVQSALEAIRATDMAEAADAATRGFDGGREWQAFSRRVADGSATPSCVIDFPYADNGTDGLNLKGDDRLLERMICLRDPLDRDPRNSLVVVHVHTLLPWGDRLKVKTAERLQAVTSVNVRHAAKTLRIDQSDGKVYTREQFVQEYGQENGMARWNASRECFQQEQYKFHVVPKSKELVHGWKDLWKKGAVNEIAWNPYGTNSVPPRDADVKWIYDDLRKVIQAGEALCRDATVAHNIHQSQMAMRGGASGEVEYEVVGVEDDTEWVRSKTCTTCGFGLYKCVCSQAAKSGVGGPVKNVWQDEPDWPTLPPPSPPSIPIRILYVGAINDDEVRLNLEREVNVIEAAFKAEHGAGVWRDMVVFRHFFFADVADLIKYLLEFKPAVVHFACHGQKSFLSLHQDELSVKKLTDIFATLSGLDAGDALRLVITNVCNSADLARALAEHVDFVIGHDKPVKDTAAIDFADGLYRPLGAGVPLLQSVTLAKTAKNCSMYCLRGRKDATQFAFVKPTLEKTVELHEVGVWTIESGQFARRDTMTTKLTRWLASPDSQRIAVVGQGGSGKSSLAQHFLHGVSMMPSSQSRTLRLVFFLQADDLMSLVKGYRALFPQLMSLLGRSETSPPDKDEDLCSSVHALLRDAAVKDTWLCVLDDLPSPMVQDLDQHGLGWLLKEDAKGFPWRSGKTIVTSRFRKWMDHPGFGQSFEVGNFEVEEAHAFLKDRVNGWRDDDGVARVAQRLGYFPLALASAVGCAKEYELSPLEYIQELDTNRSRIMDRWNKRKRTADEYPYELFEVVHATWQRLSEADDAAELMILLRQLAFLDPCDIPIEIFTDFRQHLPSLKNHCLVTVSKAKTGRSLVSVHALTQQVIRERLMGNARGQAVGVVVQALAVQMDTFDRDKPETYQACTCRAYSSHVKALLAHVGEDATEEVAELAYDTGVFFLEVTSAFADARRMFERALAIRLKLQGDNPDSKGVANCYSYLGSICGSMGDFGGALVQHEKALAMRTRVCGQDHPDVATSYNNIGCVYDSQGRYDEALQEYEKCLKIRVDKLGHEHLDVAKSYNNIGNVYDSQGHYDKALEYYQKDLDITIRVVGHDHPDVAVSHYNIGNVHQRQGRNQEAIRECDAALTLFAQRLGKDHAYTAIARTLMGKIHCAEHRYDDANEQYASALAIYSKHSDHSHRAERAELQLMMGELAGRQSNDL